MSTTNNNGNNDKKKDKKENKKVSSIVVGTKNIISDLLFFWVFFFIRAVKRTKNVKDLYLLLKECDTADYNDLRLEKKWEDEKQAAKLKDR